jgi:hypothetical protein
MLYMKHDGRPPLRPDQVMMRNAAMPAPLENRSPAAPSVLVQREMETLA